MNKQPRNLNIIIHFTIITITAILFGLYFWGIRTEVYLSFLETCKKLADSGKFLRFMLRRIACFSGIWLLSSFILKHLRKEHFISASEKVAKSFIPLLFLSLLFFRHYFVFHIDYLTFLLIFSCSISIGLLLSLFFRFEKTVNTDKILKIILLVLMCIYISWFMFLKLSDFYNFRYASTDFGIFDNAIRNVLRGRCLFSSFSGGSQLRIHFSPVLFLLAPIYLLWDDPRMLILFHTIIMTIAGLVIYLFGKDKLENAVLAFCFALGYLLLPHTQVATYCEFHESNLEPVFIFLAFYFFQKRSLNPSLSPLPIRERGEGRGALKRNILYNKFIGYWISLALMLGCKEDVFLYGATMGIVIFFLPAGTKQERSINRKIGIATFLLCLIYGIATIKVFIPYFRKGAYAFYDRYEWLGSGSKEIIVNIILHPFRILKILFTGERLKSICMTFLPVMLLPLFGGITFLLTIPALAVPLLSSYDKQYRLVLHYPASLSPFILIASIYGVYCLIRFIHGSSFFKIRLKRFLGIRSIYTSVGISVLISCFMYSLYFGYMPFKRNLDWDFFKIKPHCKIVRSFVKMIPKNVSVCAQIMLTTHVTHNPRVELFSGYNASVSGPTKCEYVFLDIQGNKYPANRNYFPSIIRLLYEGEYGVVKYEDYALLLKSNYISNLNEWAYNQIFLTFNARYLYSSAGKIVIDPDASVGYARFVSPAQNNPTNAAFTQPIECVKGNHAIDFVLKTDTLTKDTIAKLQAVLVQEKTLVAEKEIKGLDFKEANKYQSFNLNFDLPEDKNIQFQVIYLGKANLWIDRIHIKSEIMGLRAAYQRIIENE